ncbi:MAG: HAMP domain-containing protein [Ruminococcaceae bacterium]|nr:HAMP domain-containing protein [Oscillospiraceae bacterium]
MRSFYFKNFIIVAGLVMLSFIILGASFVLFGRNYMLRERQEGITENAIEISRLASAYSQDGSLTDWDFRIVLSSIAQSTGNHCFVARRDGTILTCSDAELRCRHIGQQVSQDVLDALESSGYYTALTHLGGLYDSAHYVAALPVFSSGAISAYVFVGSDASGLIRVWNSLINIFLATAISIMVLALVLGFISSKVSAKPINEMADAALKFAHGDFSARVTVDNREDEIGALAASFNQMAESLQASEQRRSEFIGNVAHELKTPMTTISGFADGILDGTIPYDQQARYLETISSETKRLNRLVRSMLDLSRMQSESRTELFKKSFDAAELLVQTLVLFEPKITAKALEVNAQLPEDPMTVCGDKDAINQVMYNLLENAVKFSEAGSELGVGIFKQNGKAYVSVKNHGPTIPANELPRIFDRFHKTDKSRSADRDGYGLGLYIVKTILGNHGEDIVVTSANGVTEFVFSLTLKQK